MIISALLTVFLLSLASTLPPPTTETASPPTTETTSPPTKGSCLCSDGTVLNIGDPLHKVSDCVYCTCTSEGVGEIYQDCARPQCVDYYSVEGDGICCPTCPNGPTCEAYHGPDGRTRTVIKADGNPVDVGDAICTCDSSGYPFDNQAICIDKATTTPVPTTESGCVCRDGKVLSVGESHQVDDCSYCICGDEGMQEIAMSCMQPMCATPYSVEGDGICCPKCPDETPTTPPPPTSTTPPPTTPPPTKPPPTKPPQTTIPPLPTCKCSDGKIIHPGEMHYITDCYMCECDAKYGAMYLIADCFFADCVDYKHVEGDRICCPLCPNGKNCEASIGGNKTIIPDGQTINMNGAKCTCDVSNRGDYNSYYPKATCVYSLIKPVAKKLN